ncbi:MAG: type II CAAX endopeptidase family protein [Pseudomonadota bacterium]
MYSTLSKILIALSLSLVGGLTIFQGMLKLGDLVDRRFGLEAALVTYLLMLPLMLLFAQALQRKLHGLDADTCGFSLGTLQFFVKGIFFGALLVAVALIATLPFQSMNLNLATSMEAMELGYLGFLVTLVSSVEEILFRGLIFLTLLIHTKRLLLSVFISALIFALTHVVVENTFSIWFLALLCLSVIFALVYNGSGSCWMAAGLHSGFNLTTEFTRRWFHTTSEHFASHFQYGLVVVLVAVAGIMIWRTTSNQRKGILQQRISI